MRLFQRVWVLGLALATALPMTASAEPIYPKHYLTLDYLHVFRDSNRASHDANGGAIGYGYGLNDVWGFEFSGFYNKYAQNDFRTTDWNEYGIKLDTLFFYSRNPWISPYWVLGVGGVRSNERVSGESSTDPFMDVGLGLMHNFNVGGFDFGIRADMRFRWIDTDGISRAGFNTEPVIRAGLVLPFGMSGTRAAAAPMRAADAEPVAAALETAPAAESTPAAARAVDATLTADEEARSNLLSPVYFGFNKTDLTPKAQQTLDEAASTIQQMSKDKAVKVKINGHTDNIGSERYNFGLSQRRAEAVSSYLGEKGVSPDVLSTQGFGKESPENDNSTAEGRAKNRRVDIKVVPAAE